MPFAVMLPSKGFTADRTDEGPLVGMGTKVRTKIVGSCEALRAERALEGGGVFLNLVLVVAGRSSGGVGQV